MALRSCIDSKTLLLSRSRLRVHEERQTGPVLPCGAVLDQGRAVVAQEPVLTQRAIEPGHWQVWFAQRTATY